MSEPEGLVAARLKDMWRVHPLQDNSNACSKCHEPVGIYPSGQQALHDHPAMPIICHVCAMPGIWPGDELRPAGSWEEIAQEIRDSKDAVEEGS